MDAAVADEPLTLACALEVEERAAHKGGARAVRVGLGASRPAAGGRLVSFGLAGALVPGLPEGTVLTATRIVDEAGSILWEGSPIAVPGARPAVLCGAARVVDEPDDRAALAKRTGAVAVDMESASLTETGRFAGAVRAISDSPDQPVGKLARASTPDGAVAWGVVIGAAVTEPRRMLRASRGARKALASLEHAAAALVSGGAR